MKLAWTIFEQVISIFGGLALFIFGMKLMSESLEKAAGNNLKKLLSKMTSNRFFGILTGFVITAIIQSSSATTVMVVSFVNAGLLNLIQSIGIIMGANIGTTVTAWIVNLAQIKVSLSLASFFVLPIAIILLFMKNNKVKNFASILIGFSIIFIGLSLLKQYLPQKDQINNNPFFRNLILLISGKGFLTLILFVLIGAIITMVLQSSSATMALTILILTGGVIEFEWAAAMVLGENIGTTITANLASLAGNKMSKKAALSHTLFNVFGVIWMLFPVIIKGKPIFFGFYIHLCKLVYNIMPDSLQNLKGFKGGFLGIQLALFHTLFNLTNTFICLWFIKYIAKFVNFIYGKEKEGEKIELSNIQFGFIKTPDLALLEAQTTVNNMAKLALKTYKKTFDLLKPKTKDKDFDEISKMENDLDIYESQIYTFLIELLREDTSVQTTDKINILLEEIRHLEWIGDSCEMISKLIKKSKDKGLEISGIDENNFSGIKDNLGNFFNLFIKNIDNLSHEEIISEGLKFESKINDLYKKLKKKSINDMKTIKKKQKKSVASGLLFMDIIKELEHIGDALKYIIKLYNSEEKITEPVA